MVHNELDCAVASACATKASRLGLISNWVMQMTWKTINVVSFVLDINVCAKERFSCGAAIDLPPM